MKSLDLRPLGGAFKTRTENQEKLVDQILEHSVTLCKGPAGSGKTMVSIGVALHLLAQNQVKRIVLSRPIVESGENLGFLPGDINSKVNVYMLPLYDCIDELIRKPNREKLMEEGIIEIAPLAYLRGRTMSDCVMILDEAQNTTKTQMKMLLTRLGKKGKMIINGDVTQNDLKHWQESGFADAWDRLSHIKGIGYAEFNVEDVVRHKLVKEIINAYDGPPSTLDEVNNEQIKS